MFGPATSVFLREAMKDTSVDNIPILKGTGLKISLLLPFFFGENGLEGRGTIETPKLEFYLAILDNF